MSAATPTDNLYMQLDQIRSYVTQEEREDVMTYGMKYMCYLILSEILEYNFAVRDMFATYVN